VHALRLRDLLLLVLLAVMLAVPEDGSRHLAAAAVMAFAVLPYNRLLQRRLVATGHVPCYLAWGDQVIAAGCALVWPELFAPAMVAAMLDVALAAVMVGRRPAVHGAVVGAVLFAAGAVAVQLGGGPAPEGHLLAVACFAVSAVATAYAVGTVAGLHRAGQEQLGALLDSLEVVIYEMDAETLESAT
jgi:hypothetical protein